MWGNHITAWNLVGGLMQCVCAGKPFTIWNGHAQPLYFLISAGQGCCRSLNVLFQMIMKQQYLFCQKCGELSHWGRVVPVNWHISSDNGLLPVRKPCRNQCGLLYPRFNEVERGLYWFHIVRLSVCPSVDRIVSALYLQQYVSDPFHIGTSYQATSEGVSRLKFVSKFKNSKFWQIL